MKRILTIVAKRLAVVALATLCSGDSGTTSPDAQKLADLLKRTAKQTAEFVDQFSDVKCIEQVRQEKLGNDNKVSLKQESTFDYLMILGNDGGELTLTESRLPVHEPKKDRKNTSMLLSNGFATLFLVFHPLYSEAFRFSLGGEEEVGGRILEKVNFQHVPGMKSPAALSLRGREYPLELQGTAWIEPETGSIAKIEADIGDSLQDVGLKSLSANIEFAPLAFKDAKQAYWFPTEAQVEVETPKQHWRNLHQFSQYKKFSVSTEEQVATK